MKKFTEFRNRLNENFNKLASENDYLFEVNLNKDELYDLYLNSFPKRTNPIFRERTEHDCSCCRSFIKRLGNAVFIIDNKIKTIWDFDAQNEIYQPVIDALDKYVKSHAVSSIYLVKKEDRLIGVEQNRDDKQIEILWDHFYLKLPEKYTYHGYKTLDTIKGDYKSSKDVLKRGLEEITKDSIETVLELISQNSLYKGNEWEKQLKAFLELKNQFDKLETEEEKDNFCWTSSLTVGSVIARIKNHSIGVLLTNISNNKSLDGAAKKYEDLFKGFKTVYGVKHRDWETGKIQGLEVITNGIDLKDKTVLMWDDIISYGGSMYHSALKLKELGVDKIYAYASHTENSILDKEKGTLIKLLEDGTVERLFTTSSLFTGEHEKIMVL